MTSMAASFRPCLLLLPGFLLAPTSEPSSAASLPPPAAEAAFSVPSPPSSQPDPLCRSTSPPASPATMSPPRSPRRSGVGLRLLPSPMGSARRPGVVITVIALAVSAVTFVLFAGGALIPGGRTGNDGAVEESDALNTVPGGGKERVPPVPNPLSSSTKAHPISGLMKEAEKRCVYPPCLQRQAGCRLASSLLAFASRLAWPFRVCLPCARVGTYIHARSVV